LCSTVALALRDPQKIDPATVSRLIELLPPPLVPEAHKVQALTVRFVGAVDSFENQLRDVLSDCQPHLASDIVIAELGARIAALEAERDGLRRDLERARFEGASATFSPNGLTGSLPNGNGSHADNVVRLPRDRDERHSLAMTTTIDQRYPRGLDPVS
jgi:hypothetical protein